MDRETKNTLIGCGCAGLLSLLLIGGEVIVRWLLSPTGWSF